MGLADEYLWTRDAGRRLLRGPPGFMRSTAVSAGPCACPTGNLDDDDDYKQVHLPKLENMNSLPKPTVDQDKLLTLSSHVDLLSLSSDEKLHTFKQMLKNKIKKKYSSPHKAGHHTKDSLFFSRHSYDSSLNRGIVRKLAATKIKNKTKGPGSAETSSGGSIETCEKRARASRAETTSTSTTNSTTNSSGGRLAAPRQTADDNRSARGSTGSCGVGSSPNFISFISGCKQPLLNPYEIPEPYRQQYTAIEAEVIDQVMATNKMFYLTENAPAGMWQVPGTGVEVSIDVMAPRVSRVPHSRPPDTETGAAFFQRLVSRRQQRAHGEYSTAVLDVYLPLGASSQT